MLYEWADNHSHQSRRPLSFAGRAKTEAALAGALSISWMGEGGGDLVCKGVPLASPTPEVGGVRMRDVLHHHARQWHASPPVR